MADKKKCVLIFLLMPIFVFVCFAQALSSVSPPPENNSPDDLNYILTETDEGLNFIQKLNWEPMEYALRYEVQIQQLKSGVYTDAAFVKTETNRAEVSLLAGNYRYKVFAYNLLDQLEAQSEWLDFLIYQAVQPEIISFSPKTLYIDQTDVLSIDLNVRKIDPAADVFLLYKGTTEKLYAQKTKVESNTMNLLFAPKSLVTGDYTIFIVNPGGLSDSKTPFTVRYFKPFDVNVSVGYSPLLLIYGKELQEYFSDIIYPLGASARLGFIFSKKEYGYWGAELFGSYNYLKKQTDGYKLTANTTQVHLNALFQLPVIKKRLYVNFRLGGGVTALFDMSFDYGSALKSKTYNSAFPSVGGGASLQVLVFKGLYLDVALDYIHVMAPKLPIGNLIPSISVGWQF